MNYAARIERLRATLEEPLLVTNPTNVRYLTGFKSSNPALLVEPDRVRLFSDFRYAETAREIPDVEFVETKRSLIADLAARLDGRIGVEARTMTVAAFDALGANGLELVPRGGLVERLRAVKDADEIAAIARACELTDGVFAALAEERFVGRTERDLAWRIGELFHERGADELAFETIVASGPNASRPHARAGDRMIGTRELVVVDAGCFLDGYCSDYTRTYAIGPLDHELKEAYTVCLQAQTAALDGISAGRTGVEADALARSVIDATPFRARFGHGLGHGLGLEVHEQPLLSPEGSEPLVAGNVTSVEPGIYLAGRGGIRIEDDVVVRDGGAENLTGAVKDLVAVD